MTKKSAGPGLVAPIEIRDAVPADLDRLTELEKRCFDSDRLSRRSFRKLIDSPTATCRVATADNHIVGYTLLLFRTGTGLARLYSIAADPAWRGHGLGDALMDAAEQYAHEEKRLYLRLEVRRDNAGAIRLYERRGY